VNVPQQYRKVRFIIGAIIGYAAVYLVLTINGEYQRSPTGDVKYSGSVAVTDRLQWDPANVYLRISGTQAFSCNFLGAIFLPLVPIDRMLWHSDVDYFK
jgi:hypothetical protein